MLISRRPAVLSLAGLVVVFNAMKAELLPTMRL